MRGRIEAVQPQQGGILALARGSWGDQSGVSRVSSFLTAGLGSSGSEVLWAEGGGFRLAEAVIPNPEVGLSRTPPLWSVLGGQAGREEDLRTEHLHSLGSARGHGQVGPHVGLLSAFSSGLCLVSSFLLLLQRGRSRPRQGKGEHYKGPTTQLGVVRVPSPPTSTEGTGPCHSTAFKCHRHYLTGPPGTRRQRQRSEACVLSSESRGGPGSIRSQGERVT